MRRRIHASLLLHAEEEDTCISIIICGGGYMHVLLYEEDTCICYYMRRIHASLLLHEEEDTCICAII